jgi:DNA-directed RNA polymerase II subunit RPB9
MLYPQEDKEMKKLLYAVIYYAFSFLVFVLFFFSSLKFKCRNCEHKEFADNLCIYVNKITHEVDELTQIVPDVISDPSLPRTTDHPCPSCDNRLAVFFQANSQQSEDKMTLYYVCCNTKCTHRWTE